jgi:predicted phage tail protein
MNSKNQNDEDSNDPHEDDIVVAEVVEVVHENVAVPVSQPSDSPANGQGPEVAYHPVAVATVVSAPNGYPTHTASVPRLENLAAKGGAVAAIVLGALAFAGSFVTSYSVINAILGAALGMWGLRSGQKKLATIGIVLCVISAFFCVVEISDWLRSIWPAEEEIY